MYGQGWCTHPACQTWRNGSTSTRLWHVRVLYNVCQSVCMWGATSENMKIVNTTQCQSRCWVLHFRMCVCVCVWRWRWRWHYEHHHPFQKKLDWNLKTNPHKLHIMISSWCHRKFAAFRSSFGLLLDCWPFCTSTSISMAPAQSTCPSFNRSHELEYMYVQPLDSTAFSQLVVCLSK